VTARKRRSKNALTLGGAVALLVILLIAAAALFEGGGLPGIWSESPAPAPSAPPAASASQPSGAGGGELRLHVLKVGKADCLLLRCGGQSLLLDGGNDADEAYIFNYLDGLGITKLDYVVNSHPHEDHLGSLDAVVLKYRPTVAFLSPKTHTTRNYEDLLLALDEAGSEVIIPAAGEGFALGGAQIEFLSPEKGAEFGDNINDWSLVMLLRMGNDRLLFMGDAESKAESALLAGGFDLRADLIKIGHHGSNTSSKKSFLQAVLPKIAVITCDKDEEKGAPNEKVLKRLEELGVEVHRTDLEGNLVFVSSGDGITLENGAGR
jgi:competence protein ComEC